MRLEHGASHSTNRTCTAHGLAPSPGVVVVVVVGQQEWHLLWYDLQYLDCVSTTPHNTTGCVGVGDWGLGSVIPPAGRVGCFCAEQSHDCGVHSYYSAEQSHDTFPMRCGAIP